MRSRSLLLLHIVINGVILMVAIGGCYFAATSSSLVAVSLGTVAIVELVGMKRLWRRPEGCPLSNLEKRLLRAEGRPSYEGSCLAHYARQWLGIPLTECGADAVSACVILLPAAGAALSLL